MDVDELLTIAEAQKGSETLQLSSEFTTIQGINR